MQPATTLAHVGGQATQDAVTCLFGAAPPHNFTLRDGELFLGIAQWGIGVDSENREHL